MTGEMIMDNVASLALKDKSSPKLRQRFHTHISLY